MKLRVLSFNIHKGFAPFGSKPVLKNIRELMRKLDPDIVFLQEVSGGSEKQFEYLADSFWHHMAYGKNAVYPKGDHGNVILSKFPIIGWSNTDLSTNRFERRGLLHARLDIPKADKTLNALCTHLDLFERNRLKQIQKIQRFLRQHLKPDEPAILAGDFNDWTGRVGETLESLYHFKEAGHALGQTTPKTFPSFYPMLTLDRIYLSNLQALSLHVVNEPKWNLLSDHRALIATVSF